ncbi:MAG TPA: hypothetical protein VK694_03300 [Verrucomicrobiae bacterium]|nr:hypothetical protein [Verrucomicrobiae bacterium]
MKTKIKNLISLPRLLAATGLVFLVWLGLTNPLGAQTAFIQGYATDQPLQLGLIVRLKQDDVNKVTPLKLGEMDKMHGVVVNSNDAAVTLSSDGQKAFVATAGRYDVVVSSQNGDIKAGDYVTLSAITGVGAKATDKEPMVVGKALAAFDGGSVVIGSTKIKDSAGAERDVKMGRIAVEIGISRNPLMKGHEPDLPQFLQRATEAIAGKPVAAVRVYIGLVVLAISTLVAGILMYGGIRSGMTSMGRNPLGKKIIIRGMLQVIISGLIIFILGLFGVYLLLKL